MKPDVKGKRAVILGIGVSGVESARFLRKQGAEIFISEGRSTERTEKTKAALQEEGFDVEVGTHTESKIAEADFAVISPGIGPLTPVYQMLERHRVPIYSEIEVASWFCEMPMVGITGTNGKTTVTTLVAKMLDENGHPALACGNIGNPFIAEIEKINREHLIPVIELSSFQLMTIESFKPCVGVLLNLDPDHLDWHRDLEEYYSAKLYLFRNQSPKDYAVLNAKDTLSLERKGKVPSRIVYFNEGETETSNPNVMACLAVAKIFEIDPKRALESLTNFSGIEHRLEAVPSGDGRIYINDSKSTNISSLVWALERMEKKVILILGGKNKGGDFSRIQHLFREKAARAVLIGTAAEEIAKALEGVIPYERAVTLQESIERARSGTGLGDVVLFSPGCASFDMFINYKDRGEQFKKLVAKLTQPCPRTVSVS